MLLQAYDFYEFFSKYGCRLQFGGQDQWGNIVSGVELVKKKLGEEVFGFTSPLLTTSDGRKMGKTANGAIWLSRDMLPAYDFWQYWRNVDDADVIKLLYLFTDIEIAEIKKMEAVKGQEINDLKKLLADEITSIVHGRESLEPIHKSVAGMFMGRSDDLSALESISKYNINRDELESKSLIDVLVESSLCESRGDAKRLLRGNGVYINDKSVGEDYKFCSEDFSDKGFAKLSSGKKKHLLIVLN
jgi:tyrosyl-tRNA synthetase